MQVDIGPYLGLPTVQVELSDVHFMPNILTDQEYFNLVMTLNRKQQEFHAHIMHQALQGSRQVLCVCCMVVQVQENQLLSMQFIRASTNCSITGKAAYNIHGTTIH